MTQNGKDNRTGTAYFFSTIFPSSLAGNTTVGDGGNVA